MAGRRSTEYYGVGQSGYTAGRQEPDRSLDIAIEVRERAYPRHPGEPVPDDEPGDLGLDERWTGRGGPPWAPDERSKARDVDGDEDGDESGDESDDEASERSTVEQHPQR